MNAPLLPEHLVGGIDAAQPDLPLASEGIERYVWESVWGRILIEVRGGDVFVNGTRVEPASAHGDEPGNGVR